MALTKEELISVYVRAVYATASGGQQGGIENIRDLNPEVADLVLNDSDLRVLMDDMREGFERQAEMPEYGFGHAFEGTFYTAFLLGITLGETFEQEAARARGDEPTAASPKKRDPEKPREKAVIFAPYGKAVHPFYSGERELRPEDLRAIDAQAAHFVLNDTGVKILASDLKKGIRRQAAMTKSDFASALEANFRLTLLLGIMTGRAFEREAARAVPD